MNESDSGVDSVTDLRDSAADEDTHVLTRAPELDTVESTSNGAAPQEDKQGAEEKKKRSWVIPLAVGLSIVLLIAAVAALLVLNADEKGRDRAASRGGEKQANWQITSFPIGGKKSELPAAQTKAIGTLVRRWSDAVYLFPGEVKSVTQRFFIKDAADAFRSSDIGLPNDARQVETQRRTARIGIDVNGAKRAAVRVEVVATGKSSKGEFRSMSDSHLWLERDGSNWRVIAFDIDQKPLPLHPNKGGRGKDADKASGKAGKPGPDKGKGKTSTRGGDK